jgi:hypothetical protein
MHHHPNRAIALGQTRTEDLRDAAARARRARGTSCVAEQNPVRARSTPPRLYGLPVDIERLPRVSRSP